MYNWKIIGHKKQLERIEEDIKSGNISHAYLIGGPSSVGKFAIAKMFTNILQCPNNLCHECPTCIQVQKGSHADTVILDSKDSIKIEQIREIISKLNMTKQSNYKILLIKEVERMTTEAANCLLKTLEEPPPNTIIIMTTDNVRAILPTIISRVRLIKLNSFSQKYLTEKLKELYPGTDEKTIDQVCSLSLGKSGKAIKLLDDSALLASYKSMYNILCDFLEDKPLDKKFGVIEEVLAEDGNVSEFLDVFTHLVRSRLHQEKSSHLLGLLNSIEETRNLLKRNVNAKLALENLALKSF